MQSTNNLFDTKEQEADDNTIPQADGRSLTQFTLKKGTVVESGDLLILSYESHNGLVQGTQIDMAKIGMQLYGNSEELDR